MGLSPRQRNSRDHTITCLKQRQLPVPDAAESIGIRYPMFFVQAKFFTIQRKLCFYQFGKFAIAHYTVAPAAVVYIALVATAYQVPYFLRPVGECLVQPIVEYSADGSGQPV